MERIHSVCFFFHRCRWSGPYQNVNLHFRLEYKRLIKVIFPLLLNLLGKLPTLLLIWEKRTQIDIQKMSRSLRTSLFYPFHYIFILYSKYIFSSLADFMKPNSSLFYFYLSQFKLVLMLLVLNFLMMVLFLRKKKLPIVWPITMVSLVEV